MIDDVTVRVGPGEGHDVGQGDLSSVIPAVPRGFVASTDRRSQATESLIALVRDSCAALFCGALKVFRAQQVDRVKIVSWDGSGMWLFGKRLDEHRFKASMAADWTVFGCRVAPRGSSSLRTAAALARLRTAPPKLHRMAGDRLRTFSAVAPSAPSPCSLRRVARVARQPAKIVCNYVAHRLMRPPSSRHPDGLPR